MKRAFKYLVIIGLNFVALTSLLLLWTDPLEIQFNELIRQLEALKLFCLSILLLVLVRLQMVLFTRKANFNIRDRLKRSIVITIFFSSYFYITYSLKAVENRIIHKEVRESVFNKVEPLRNLAQGSKAKNLTFKEYSLIAQIGWFPEISPNATKISYEYAYDGFLPDYSFILRYYIPKNETIDEFDIQNGDFSNSLKVERKGRMKFVEYIEAEQ